MKQSTCGAVICQPGGDELKHDSIFAIYLITCIFNVKLFNINGYS